MLYIATHKKFKPPVLDEYKVLQVGAENKEDIGYIRDNIGDNISNKNANYCELTGLYWIWKNTNDSYKGLVHYRRYFGTSFSKKSLISSRQVKKILEKNDAILPYKRTLEVSLKEQYMRESGFEKDLISLRNIINELCPEYLKDYDDVMNGNKSYFYNMLIAKKELFDSYCEWLFDILFELEKKVDLTGYNNYQKRIYGFLSERLLTVYVIHNNLKIFELGIIETESKYSIVKSLLISCKRFCKYNTNKMK